MNTKSKIVLSISVVVALVATATIAIVAVWAATQQKFTSSISVKYTAASVKGEATARWKVGTNDWQNMTTTGKTDGEQKLTFDTEANSGAALSPTENIILTDENPYVVFEYSFTNTSTKEFAIDLFYNDDSQKDTNISVTCLNSDAQITNNFLDSINTNFGDWTTTTISGNNGKKYVYVLAQITDIFENASYSGSFKFDLDGKNYSSALSFEDGAITGLNDNVTTLRIPSTINEQAVTRIKTGAFAGKTSLTEVIIPESVTTIEQGAFNKGCSNLKYMSIPFVGNTRTASSVPQTTFGYIFGANDNYGSDNGSVLPTTLTNVIVTGGTSIGQSAFQSCSRLTSITILSSLENIRTYAFMYCEGLTSVSIPSSVERIDANAFYYCRGLTSIKIPSSVERIWSSAFNGCSGLKEVTIESQTVCKNIATWEGSSSTKTYLTNYAKTIKAKYQISGLTGYTSQGQQGNYYIYTKN